MSYMSFPTALINSSSAFISINLSATNQLISCIQERVSEAHRSLARSTFSVSVSLPPSSASIASGHFGSLSRSLLRIVEISPNCNAACRVGHLHCVARTCVKVSLVLPVSLTDQTQLKQTHPSLRMTMKLSALPSAEIFRIPCNISGQFASFRAMSVVRVRPSVCRSIHACVVFARYSCLLACLFLALFLSVQLFFALAFPSHFSVIMQGCLSSLWDGTELLLQR